MLYIEGEINYSQYEKDGVTKYSTDIIVREFNFIGSGDGGQNTQQGGGYQGNQGSQGNQGGNYQGNQGGSGYQSNNGPSQGNQGPNSNNFQGQTNPGMTGGQGSIPDDDIPF